jgi:hypothetical protein
VISQRFIRVQSDLISAAFETEKAKGAKNIRTFKITTRKRYSGTNLIRNDLYPKTVIITARLYGGRSSTRRLLRNRSDGH